LRGKSLLCVLVLSLAWAPSCSGAAPSSEPAKYDLSIRSQPLDTALQEFARQTGIQIIFFSRLTEGLRASELDGQYTIAAALGALLAGSKLTFRVINPKAIEIRPLAGTPSPGTANSPPTPLTRATEAKRNRNSSENSTEMEEVVVAATAEGLVATRTETPLRAIPQTISIISDEQIRQQNDTDLADALDHAAGITVVRTDSLDQNLYSRGFRITSLHIDGGAAQNSFNPSPLPYLGTPDLSEFDHIEVLRGADGLFGASGNPGATVNMVRKRPLQSAAFMFDASTGSWNNRRAEVDVTGPIGFDGQLLGRLDALYADRNYFYETASLQRERIFGALEYDFTPSTVMIAGGSYQWDDAVPFTSGLPLNQDGSDPHLSRHTALTFDWARYRTRTREIYLQLRQEFNRDWRLKIDTAAWKGSLEYAVGYFQSQIDPITHGLDAPPYASTTPEPNTQNQFEFGVTLTGGFDWFGRRAQVAFGGDFARLKVRSSYNDFPQLNGLVSNVYAYDPATYPDPRLTQPPIQRIDIVATLRQSGLFASLRTPFGDGWSAVGGARISGDRTDTTVSVSSPAFNIGPRSISLSFGNSRVVTPYAAVMYDVDNHYSLYASYADIYLATGKSREPNGRLLGPAHGVDVEAGLKGAWREGAVNGSLVLYQIVQHEIPIFVSPAHNIDSCCYIANTNRSKGIDAELSGVLAPGWLISAGYTFNNNQAAPGGALSDATPRHLLKLWTSKRLAGSLNRWTLGGTVHAQSSNSQSGRYCPLNKSTVTGFPHTVFCGPPVPFHVVQRPYLVMDLRASFQIDPHWQAEASVGDIFDRTYYETIAPSQPPLGNNWYGPPRSLLLRIDGRY
jgi:outer membrane receptor for ferric coprogen and ferric-rhodotorulic acid